MNVAGLFVGLATLDLVYQVPEPPAPNRKAQATGQDLAAGGPAANAAVTFAALRALTGTPAVPAPGLPLGRGGVPAGAGVPPGPAAAGVPPGLGVRLGAAPAASPVAGSPVAGSGVAGSGVAGSGVAGSGVAGVSAGAVVLVTALGRHSLAGVVAGELASRQVTVCDATPGRVEPPAVSSAWVVAGGGERSVVSVNAGGVAAEPPAGLAGLAAGAPVLLVDGHHLALAVAAASAARAAGRPVLLDGGSWKPGLDALLPLVDVAACGADFRVPGTDSADASAAALLDDYGVPAVAITAGPSPIRWWHRALDPAGPDPAGPDPAGPDPAGPDPAGPDPAGPAPGPARAAGAEPTDRRTAAARPPTATGAVPVPVVDAVDTLGAGDAFHGALAWAYATAPERAQAQWPERAAARPPALAADRAPARPPALAAADRAPARPAELAAERPEGPARPPALAPERPERPGLPERPQELAAALAFAARVAAVRCETAGPRRWLDDPRLAGLAREWLGVDRGSGGARQDASTGCGPSARR